MRNGIAAFRVIPYIKRSNTRLKYLAKDLDRINQSDSEGDYAVVNEHNSEEESSNSSTTEEESN